MTIIQSDPTARLAPHQGDWLRKALEYRGMTAAQMEKVIHVSRRTMTNYLGGHTSPKPWQLEAWAEKCNLPVTYLTSGILPDDFEVHPPRFELGTHWITVARPPSRSGRTGPRGRSR